MPSVYDLKPAFQQSLRPVVRLLARCGVTANQVTIGAFVFCAASAYAIGSYPERQALLWLAPVHLLRMAFNAIDGMLAREHQQQSALGAILNEITDVLADAFLLYAFAEHANWSDFWVGALIFLSTLSEMTGVLGPTIGASRRQDGPFGKSDRAFAYSTLGLGIGYILPTNDIALTVPQVFCGLSILTIGNRARKALQENRVSR